MHNLLEAVSAKTGKDVTRKLVISANCDNDQSLNEMAKCGRVIINCCGPYKLYGEPVVKACIQNSTHYIDVCGEPEFMGEMELYDNAARENDCYVISACGMDSGIGVLHFIKNFDGTGWSSDYLQNVEYPTTLTDPTNVYMITSLEMINPGYGFTAMSAVLRALIILEEKENLPAKGGVYTPAEAFYNTKTLDKLQNGGAVFKVLEKHRK